VSSGKGSSGGAFEIGGDQLGDVALIEVLAQVPRRFAPDLGGTRRVRERLGVAKVARQQGC
jgi:hypothetical protein